MEALQIFNYNNTPVTFKNENGVIFISATEMAQGFGKRPSDFLRLPSTEKFLTELEAVRKSHRSEIIKSENGVGTWMNEDIAIEFARWLSPSFAIWANDRIKELLRHGITSTDVMMEQMLINPDAMINALTALKVEREEKQRLLVQTQLQQIELAQSAPKAQYYDEVLQSSETYVITRIAQELGISAVSMNKKLQDMKVQRKVDGQWVLYAQYVGNGYTRAHTTTFTKSSGETGTNTQTVWTEKGRQFIHSLFKSN